MGISLSGLSSGLDTNTMVSELMKIERIPYTRTESSINVGNAKINAFRSLNTTLNSAWTKSADLVLNTKWNTKLVNFDDEKQNIADVKAGSTAVDGRHNIEVKSLAQTSAYASRGLSADADARHLNGQTITLFDGVTGSQKDITISEATTMKDVFAQISEGLRGTGINANSLKTTETETRLIMSTRKTGTANEISFGDDFDGTKQVLKMSGEMSAALGLTQTQKATDATIVSNGLTISRSSNEISDVIDGVTLNLKETGTLKFDVQRDTEGLKKELQSFFDSFNGIMSTLKAVSSKEGALSGNSAIRSLTNTLSAMGSYRLNSEKHGFSMITEYGIEMDKGAKNASDFKSTFSVDYDKLMKKLEEDPKKTEEFMTKFIDGVRDTFRQYSSTTGVFSNEIRSIETTNKNLSDRLGVMNLQLQMKEERMLKQFATMESMLSSLNNEKDWLTSQLNSLSGTNNK